MGININIKNIPQAIAYFLAGTVLNLILYYTLAPTQANLLGIMENIFQMDEGTTTIIWLGIISITIMTTIILSAWTIIDKEE